MINFLKKLFGKADHTELKEALQSGAFLVDVRTPSEFASGSAKGAVNIPLDKIATQLSKFKDKKQIVVFCRSGFRSSQAKSILKQNGFQNVINGGTVHNITNIVNNLSK